MAIGEAGSIITGSPGENDPITITFTEPLTDPVLSLTATNNGVNNPFVLRVTDISLNTDGDAIGFTFIMEEWEYLDGPHPLLETINWIAIEEGVHTLPDGRIVEAGTVNTNPGSGNTPVSLTGGFTDPPVVLTSVMSENDTTTVDSDPLDITVSGFNIQMQEEEAEADDHASETVGYIAIQLGASVDSGSAVTASGLDDLANTFGLGATYTNNPVVVAETQTINGGNPGHVAILGQTNSTIDLILKEEQSNDAELFHVEETVGIVAFEAGLILCFTPGTYITTPVGPIEISYLKQGDIVITKDNGLQPIRWIGGKRVTKLRQMIAPHIAPIYIKAGSLGFGRPNRDLWVSPQHRFLISHYKTKLYFNEDEIFVPAKALVNDINIWQENAYEDTYYYHIMFDQHQVIYANGIETESLHPGHLAKDGLDGKARDELFEIFPELRCHPESYGKAARPIYRYQESQILKSCLPTLHMQEAA